MKFSSLIVDDDAMSRKAIEKLCNKTNHVEVVGICESAEEAMSKLDSTYVDLMFLDVEMPGLSGIELLQELKSPPLAIITSSKEDYAYEAFEYQVVDYLKKPIPYERFMKAIELAIVTQEKINAFKKQSQDIYVRHDGKFVRVPFDEILFFENAGDYVRIKTTTKNLIIHSTLKHIDQRLMDPRFLRVHRSFIINLTKIEDIEENTLVIDKDVIPISRANKSTLMGRLNFL